MAHKARKNFITQLESQIFYTPVHIIRKRSVETSQRGAWSESISTFFSVQLGGVLRTKYLELAQQRTKDTDGKGGPSETHFREGEVNSKGWSQGLKFGRCVLGDLRRA